MKSKKLGYCNISLPEWSLEGDGYTVSIQKKVIWFYVYNWTYFGEISGKLRL